MNNFCVQPVLHSKMRMQQRKWSTDSRWVDIIPWIQHWLLRRKGCSYLTQSIKMFPFSSNQFWQVSVNLFSSTEVWRREFLKKWQPIFWMWKELSSGCVCCVWMCDLYLKYEPTHRRWRGFSKHFVGISCLTRNSSTILHFFQLSVVQWFIRKDR